MTFGTTALFSSANVLLANNVFFITWLTLISWFVELSELCHRVSFVTKAANHLLMHISRYFLCLVPIWD